VGSFASISGKPLATRAALLLSRDGNGAVANSSPLALAQKY
jgi:hypothetical protein